MNDQVHTAERQARRPSGAESAADRRRRGQAIAGAVAGVGVVVVLVALFIGVRLAGRPAHPAAAPAPAAAASAAPPSAAAPSQAPQTAANPAAPSTVKTPAALRGRPVVKAGSGTLSTLKVTYLVRGGGPKVRVGQTVTANYVLVSYKTGQMIDSSWDRGQPFQYQAGAGNIIKGWDQGLLGVPVGSRVRLDVPAGLGYGAQQGDLRFVVDVLAAS